MAKSVIKRDYKTPNAVAAGLITFSSIDDEADKVVFNVAELVGGKDAYEALTPYGRWSLMRDANNTLGDTFAGDPDSFKVASQARYDKFLAGELGRVAGGGGGKSMNDNILALMRVTGKTEDDCREKWLSLSEENDAAGNPVTEEAENQSELDDWKNHPKMKAARTEIRDERAKAKGKLLKKAATEADDLDF